MWRSYGLTLALCLLSLAEVRAAELVSVKNAASDAVRILQSMEPNSADSEPAAAQTCCKVCRKGKACGDSCIARNKTCTKPPGCACDAQ